MTSLADPLAPSYRGVAEAIADELCRTSYECDGQRTWLGAEANEDSAEPDECAYGSVGGDLYGGTAGIALFLAEMYARTGDAQLRVIIEGAAKHAIARMPGLQRRFRFGFYGGALGVGFALIRIGECVDRMDFHDEGRRILLGLCDDTADDMVLDVLSGASGAIAPLLSLAASLGEERLDDVAVCLGNRIVGAAERNGDHASWGESATGFDAPRNLTGFAHGAGGIAWGLMELFAHTGDERFRDLARAGFRYETASFDALADNWPDYRFHDGTEMPVRSGLAWCTGAPGEGLSRLRACLIDPTVDYFADVAAAMRAVKRGLEYQANPDLYDFSLCHGWAGIAEFLLSASRLLDVPDGLTLANRIADAGAARHGGSGTWHCGLPHGSSPSLMLGTAGIGYFYLRLADPSVRSLLLAPATPSASN